MEDNNAPVQEDSQAIGQAQTTRPRRFPEVPAPVAALGQQRFEATDANAVLLAIDNELDDFEPHNLGHVVDPLENLRLEQRMQTITRMEEWLQARTAEPDDGDDNRTPRIPLLGSRPENSTDHLIHRQQRHFMDGWTECHICNKNLGTGAATAEDALFLACGHLCEYLISYVIPSIDSAVPIIANPNVFQMREADSRKQGAVSV